jgi:hypothetical protein
LRFEIEQGKLYHYRRYVRVKPPAWEERWFKFENGEFVLIDQGQGDQTPRRFLDPITKAYADRGIYSVFYGGDRALALEHINSCQ